MAVTKAILGKWLVAQKRHRLSDRQVQMARELGLNPDKLGKIDNHRQEVWKAPLPQFIVSDCSTTSCAFDFSVECPPL